MRPTTFCQTVGAVEDVALLSRIHYSLAKMKAETPVCTLPDVDAKTSAITMAHRLAGVKAVKVGETLTDVTVAAPVLTLVATLTEVAAKTNAKTLTCVEVKAPR